MSTNRPTVLDIAPSWVAFLLKLGLASVVMTGVLVGIAVYAFIGLPSPFSGLVALGAGVICIYLFAVVYVTVVERTLGKKYRQEHR